MRNKLLGWSMLAATVLVAVWRTLTLPAVAGNGTALTHISYPLLLLMAVVTVVLLLLGRIRNDYTEPALYSRVLTVGGALFGAVLMLSSLWDIVRFMWKGISPAPNDATISSIDRILLSVSMLAGFLGGLFLTVWFVSLFLSPDRPFTAWGRQTLAIGGTVTGVLTLLLFFKGYQIDTRALDMAGVSAGGIQRMSVMVTLIVALAAGVSLIVACIRAANAHTLSEKWLWLLPPLWAFARLARYNVVYASSVDISPAVYEFFLYALILLFLLETAKYLSDAQPATHHLRGLSAATAALCIAASLSRLILFLMGEKAAVAYCSIPSVTEAALGLFAAAMTVVLQEGRPRHSKG